MHRFTIAIVLLAAVVARADFSPPLGATPDASGTTFRVWAPFVDDASVTINNGTPIPLAKESGHSNPSDLTWSVHVPNAKPGDLYRYVIRCEGVDRQFNDPRAWRLSSPVRNAAWSVIVDPGTDAAPFTSPALNDLVVYELHVGTFHADENGKFTFTGATQGLDYLKSLGISAVQIMPVNENQQDRGHVPADYNWGYDPLTYFSIKSDYGTPDDLKAFVNACHARGMAAILDVVYNHAVSANFLDRWGGFAPPYLADGVYFYGGPHGRSPWGPRPDFGREQVRDYVADNVRTWIRHFGFDGLRWDSVSNLRAFDDRAMTRTANQDGISFLRAMNSEFASKVMIAEDLRGAAVVTNPVDKGGLGFNSQWDNNLCGELRKLVGATSDGNRRLASLSSLIQRKIGTDAFARVIYSEDHDQVGHPTDTTGGKPQVRVPAVADPTDPQSTLAKKLSNLAAAIIMTSPGVPMIFQGQETLDPRTFDFGIAADVDWDRVQTEAGVLEYYHDLITLRRNLTGKTAGLRGQNTRVFHVDDANHVIAYRRWENGGAGDDVIVVVNVSQSPKTDLRIGLPASGRWLVRLGSGPNVYARSDPFDGLPFSGHVQIAPFDVLILSQD